MAIPEYIGSFKDSSASSPNTSGSPYSVWPRKHGTDGGWHQSWGKTGQIISNKCVTLDIRHDIHGRDRYRVSGG
jgi:hypothetical protein